MADFVEQMTRKEVLSLQKVYRRMKRMGIKPERKKRIILSLEQEIQQYRKKLFALEGLLAERMDFPPVFFLCDESACKRCSDECSYTRNPDHAKNFKEIYGAFWEQGGADE